MTKAEIFRRIEEIGIIPAVRTSSAEDALFASRAVFDGGILIAEITMTIPGAVEVISELVRTVPDAIVGAGTVLDVDTAQRCLSAGASFLTSTGLDLELVDFSLKHEIPIIPGVLTPTEVMAARKAGADLIKVFPCSSMGGASYIRFLKSAFPHIALIASGGVTQNTATDFVRAGASGLGVGRDLLPRHAIQQKDANWIRELARRFLGMIAQGRAQGRAAESLDHGK